MLNLFNCVYVSVCTGVCRLPAALQKAFHQSVEEGLSLSGTVPSPPPYLSSPAPTSL